MLMYEAPAACFRPLTAGPVLEDLRPASVIRFLKRHHHLERSATKPGASRLLDELRASDRTRASRFIGPCTIVQDLRRRHDEHAPTR